MYFYFSIVFVASICICICNLQLYLLLLPVFLFEFSIVFAASIRGKKRARCSSQPLQWPNSLWRVLEQQSLEFFLDGSKKKMKEKRMREKMKEKRSETKIQEKDDHNLFDGPIHYVGKVSGEGEVEMNTTNLEQS